MTDTVYLIDTFSLMFQVFHGIPPMTSPSGLPTNAIFGFSRDLVSLLQSHRPTWLICATESTGTGKREELYPDYKANRGEMPEDLRAQIPHLIETIQSFRIPVVSADGWEADDVIATLTRQAVERGYQVRIVTSDKDARQLLGPQVQILNLRKGTHLGEAELLADWGVRPDQVIDFQALVGDAVDNVPGVPLVGPKKAAALLQQFETLEGVLSNADKAPGAKLKENLKAFADQARLSQKLVQLRQDLDITFDWDSCRNPVPDVFSLQELFRKFGFRKLVDDVRQFAPEKNPDLTVAPKAHGRSLFQDAQSVELPVTGTRTIPRNSGKDEAANQITSQNSDKSQDETASLASPQTQDFRETGEHSSNSLSFSTQQSNPIVRQWELINTREKFNEFVEKLHSQNRFCLDLETTGLDPRSDRIVGWAFCWSVGSAYYLPTLGPEGSELLDYNLVVETLRPILESPDRLFVNQNIKFDLMMLAAHDIHVPAEAIDMDPMVGDYLLDAGARSHSLEVLIEKYLGVKGIPITELIGSGKNQKNMSEVPVEKVAEYATEDADLTFRLADIIAKRLKDEGLWDLYWNLERPLIPLLAEMEQTGICVNSAELNQQGTDLSNRLTLLITEIHSLAGREFNIDSPKQLQVVLFEELGLPIKRKTKTGASTDQEVLEELASLHPLPAKIIEHRHLSKLKGTYLDALPKIVHPSTGRIHTSFNQVVAATGRLSSSDPNLQNIPIRTPEGERIRRAFVAQSFVQTISSSPTTSLNGDNQTNGNAANKSIQQPEMSLRTRDLFSDLDEIESTPQLSTASSSNTIPREIASESWKLVCADYSQIELRVLAHFSQDRELINAFNEGIDIHTAVASQVFAVTHESVTSDQRRMAKAVNFGVIYGQSPFGLAAALGIPQDEAAAFIDGYFAKYTGVTQFIQETLEEVKRTGQARTLLGRRRPIDGIRDLRTGNLNMPERTAINTVIQGSAADLIKRAMLAVRHRIREERHPARMLLQIHDELVFESPDAEVASLTTIVRHEMQHAIELAVPLVVDISIGDNWLDTAPLAT